MRIDFVVNPDLSKSSGSRATAEVTHALRAASKATGVDFAYLTAKAALESNLDPSARAGTSSAAGLFQFIESTWADMVERHGAKIGLGDEAAALAGGDLPAAERQRIMDLRFDAGIAARLGAEFAAENAQHLSARLGREPDEVDLYLAHFLGPGGAARFLKGLDQAPDGSAAAVFPAAAKANRSIFYDGARARGFQEVRDRFEAKLTAHMDSAPGSSAAARPVSLETLSAGPVVRTGRPAVSASLGGDPWLSALVSAQLTLNDTLAQASRGDDRRNY